MHRWCTDDIQMVRSKVMVWIIVFAKSEFKTIERYKVIGLLQAFYILKNNSDDQTDTGVSASNLLYIQIIKFYQSLENQQSLCQFE